MRVALDAMGGDFAPGPNVEGALAALREHDDLEVVLVGDEAQLEPLLSACGPLPGRLRVQPSEGWIRMDEKPTEALRRKPRCSILVCWELLATRQVDAVVSAGHTGAVVAAGLRTRQFLPGVKRPGIAAPLPTRQGRTVLVDVGANPAARPEHLVQYAVMGSVYAREMLGIAAPRVGVMNIGAEDGKGNDLVRETQFLLAQSFLKERYIGSVEGRELFQGTADVVICEGFVGNVLLKSAEGLAELILHTLSEELFQKTEDIPAPLVRRFSEFARRYYHHEAGGAPLLGVDGICLICHGSSSARSIQSALRTAQSFKNRQINAQIVQELARLEPVAEPIN